MKKNWLILLMSIVLGAMTTGCSDDDDGKKNEIPTEVIGKWKLEDMKIGVLQTSDTDIREIANEIFRELTSEYYSGEVVELYDNGTGTYKGESIKYAIDKYTLAMTDSYGDKLKFSFIVFQEKLILTLNMKEVILNDSELSKEEIAYVKESLQQFTIDFIYGH